MPKPNCPSQSLAYQFPGERRLHLKLPSRGCGSFTSMLEQGLSTIPCTSVKNVFIVFSPPFPPRIFSPHFANPWVAEKGGRKVGAGQEIGAETQSS